MSSKRHHRIKTYLLAISLLSFAIFTAGCGHDNHDNYARDTKATPQEIVKALEKTKYHLSYRQSLQPQDCAAVIAGRATDIHHASVDFAVLVGKGSIPCGSAHWPIVPSADSGSVSSNGNVTIISNAATITGQSMKLQSARLKIGINIEHAVFKVMSDLDFAG